MTGFALASSTRSESLVERSANRHSRRSIKGGLAALGGGPDFRIHARARRGVYPIGRGNIGDEQDFRVAARDGLQTMWQARIEVSRIARMQQMRLMLENEV
jgi:hypothetical protein